MAHSTALSSLRAAVARFPTTGALLLPANAIPLYRSAP